MKTDDVKQLALLSRIKLTDDELMKFGEDMDSILGYVNHLKKLSLGEREAIVPPHANPLRDDTPTHEPGTFSARIIDAFPKKEGRHALVKKILTTDDAD